MFFEEPDLADMLSDTGVDVTWQPTAGDPVVRKGLFERHTAPALDGVEVPVGEKNPSVLVERAYFEAVEDGDELTVDGVTWVVRQTGVPMRSMLRLYLTTAPVTS